MGILNLLFMAVGLSMDAFAVSVCKGMAMKEMSWKNALKAGLYFGGFQALMPALGYLLGSRLHSLIAGVDHWIALGLLVFIGGKMIVESFDKDNKTDCSFAARTMLVLAVATSIDALAVGITLGFLQTNILLAVALIGVITFLLSFLGVKIGTVFGNRLSSRAELAGGIILILIGVKIVLEHLNVISF